MSQMTSIKPGDKVLWTEELTTTFEVKAIKELPTGCIVVAELAAAYDGMAPFKLEASEDKFIAVPDGWQDAPERPACRGGRFDGSGQDDAARHEWFVAMVNWDKQYRQPLRDKLSQPDEEVKVVTMDPVIANALEDNLTIAEFGKLRTALLRHHNLPNISGAIVYSGCGWYIALGFGEDKIEGKGQTLGTAVGEILQKRQPLSPAEQLFAALKNDPDTLRLAKVALGLNVSAGASAS